MSCDEDIRAELGDAVSGQWHAPQINAVTIFTLATHRLFSHESKVLPKQVFWLIAQSSTGEGTTDGIAFTLVACA